MGDDQTSRPGGLHFHPPSPMAHLHIPRFDNGAFAVYTHQTQSNNVTFIGQAPQPANNSPPLFVAPQPIPGLPQAPILAPVSGQHFTLSGVPVEQAPQPAVAMVGAAFVTQIPQFPPDVTGIGGTAAEVTLENTQSADKDKLYEPQDFKPMDDDPLRYYPVRELDGNWTQRNRLTIDNLGDCRWYVSDTGYFYAVRLPN